VKVNQKMRSELEKTLPQVTELPQELSEILKMGLCVVDDCVFLLSLLSIDTNAELHDFPDRTGYECFINSIHIDDYVTCDYLESACVFARELYLIWRGFGALGGVRFMVMKDEFGVLIKFHKVRSGESFFADDLELYEDASMVFQNEEVFDFFP
jgi:hypothetical protein